MKHSVQFHVSRYFLSTFIKAVIQNGRNFVLPECLSISMKMAVDGELGHVEGEIEIFLGSHTISWPLEVQADWMVRIPAHTKIK